MERKSNLRQIATALFEQPQPRSPQFSDRTSGKFFAGNGGEGLKRKGESEDSYSPTRSRSDASSYDAENLVTRKGSLQGSANTEDDDDGEFFDCEDGEKSKRFSIEGPPNKRKNDVRTNNHLVSRIQGPSRLRYWDSADHNAILARAPAGSM